MGKFSRRESGLGRRERSQLATGLLACAALFAVAGSASAGVITAVYDLAPGSSITTTTPLGTDVDTLTGTFTLQYDAATASAPLTGARLVAGASHVTVAPDTPSTLVSINGVTDTIYVPGSGGATGTLTSATLNLVTVAHAGVSGSLHCAGAFCGVAGFVASVPQPPVVATALGPKPATLPALVFTSGTAGVGDFSGTSTVMPQTGVTVVQNFVGKEISRTFVGSAPALCADGLDNDGDGLVDLADTGCASAADTSERDATEPCDDGVDDDLDGATDFDPVTFADPGDSTRYTLGQGDPGCKSPTHFTESPQCQDGISNDGDGKIDFDAGFSVNGVADPGGPDAACVGTPWRDKEKKKSCGLGFEVAVIAPLFLLGRRTLRRRQRA